MTTLRLFSTLSEAREYRHTHNTGGWIFEPDDHKESILFPPDWTPTTIMYHPTTNGRSGRLIGSM